MAGTPRGLRDPLICRCPLTDIAGVGTFPGWLSLAVAPASKGLIPQPVSMSGSKSRGRPGVGVKPGAGPGAGKCAPCRGLRAVKSTRRQFLGAPLGVGGLAIAPPGPEGIGDQGARPRLRAGIPGGQRQRLAPEGLPLRGIVLPEPYPPELDPQQGIVGLDPQRTLQGRPRPARNCCWRPGYAPASRSLWRRGSSGTAARELPDARGRHRRGLRCAGGRDARRRLGTAGRACPAPAGQREAAGA